MTKHRRQIFFFLLGELMDRITELEFLFLSLASNRYWKRPKSDRWIARDVREILSTILREVIVRGQWRDQDVHPVRIVTVITPRPSSPGRREKSDYLRLLEIRRLQCSLNNRVTLSLRKLYYYAIFEHPPSIRIERRSYSTTRRTSASSSFIHLER